MNPQPLTDYDAPAKTSTFTTFTTFTKNATDSPLTVLDVGTKQEKRKKE